MSEVPFDLQRLRSAEIAKGSVTEASHASEVSSRQRSRRSARTVSQVGQHPPSTEGGVIPRFQAGFGSALFPRQGFATTSSKQVDFRIEPYFVEFGDQRKDSRSQPLGRQDCRCRYPLPTFQSSLQRRSFGLGEFR